MPRNPFCYLLLILPFTYRPLRECDLLTPEQGRCVAREMNAPYFESSVLTHFGVSEVFENVIRVALTARRSQRFWITNLRNIKRPMVQRPFCPPKPSPPMVTIPKANFDKDIASLLTNSSIPDVAIKINGKVVVYVHRIILAAASGVLKNIFTLDSSVIETNQREEQIINHSGQINLENEQCKDHSITSDSQSNDECKLCFQNTTNNWQNTNEKYCNSSSKCNSVDDSAGCLLNYASINCNNNLSTSLLLRRHSPSSTTVRCCKCNDVGCSSCCKCYVNEVTQVEDEIQQQQQQLEQKEQLQQQQLNQQNHHDILFSLASGQSDECEDQLLHVSQRCTSMLADESSLAVGTPLTGTMIQLPVAIEGITSSIVTHEMNVTSAICSSLGDTNVAPSISKLPSSCNEIALTCSSSSSITSEIAAIEANTSATCSSSSSSSSTSRCPCSVICPSSSSPPRCNTQGEIKFSSSRVECDGHSDTQLHPPPASELERNSFPCHPQPIDMETSIQVKVNRSNCSSTEATTNGHDDVVVDDAHADGDGNGDGNGGGDVPRGHPSPFLATSSDTGHTAAGGFMSISTMDIDTIVEQSESGVSLTSITDSMANGCDLLKCKIEKKIFSSPSSSLNTAATATTNRSSSINRSSAFYKPSHYFNQPHIQLTRSASDSSISSSAEFLREKDALSFSSNGSTNNSSAYLIHSSEIESSSQLAKLSFDAGNKCKDFNLTNVNCPNSDEAQKVKLMSECNKKEYSNFKLNSFPLPRSSESSSLNDQSKFDDKLHEQINNCTVDNRQCSSSAVKLSTIKNVAAALISSAASSCIPRSSTTIIKGSSNNCNQVNCCHCSGHKLKVIQVNKVNSQFESTLYSSCNGDEDDNENKYVTCTDESSKSSQLLCNSKCDKLNHPFSPTGNLYDLLSCGNNLQLNYQTGENHLDHISSCHCICTSNCGYSNCGANCNRKFVHFGHRMRSNSWQTLPAFLKQSPSFIQMVEKITSKIHQQQQLNQQQQQQQQQQPQQQQPQQQQQQQQQGSSKLNCTKGLKDFGNKGSLKSEKRQVVPFVWSLKHPLFEKISLEKSPIYADCFDYLNYSSSMTKCQPDFTCNSNSCNGSDVTDDEVYSSGSSDDLICTRKNCTNRSKAVSCFGKKLAFNSNCTHSSSNSSRNSNVKSAESNFGYSDCQTFSHEGHMMTVLTVKSNSVSTESLEQVINFIYTGSYPDLKIHSPTLSLAKEVLYLADLLDIKQLSNSVKATYCQTKEMVLAGTKGSKVLNSQNITASTSNSFSVANSYVNSPSVILNNRQLIAADESGISSGYGSSDRINYDSSVKSFSQTEISPLTSSDCLFEFCDTSKLDHLTSLKSNLVNLALNQGLFHDVSFLLDDGSLVNCHRFILSARCEMMAAMFRGDFLESFSKLIKFPGVNKQTFNQLLYYFYTDSVKCDVKPNNCIKLLELANRLCLPNLVCLVEEKIIHDLTVMADESFDSAAETCLSLLESCQIHNCDQLADYCLYYLSVNYKDVSQRQSKILRSLHPENQAYLNRNRWPPIWFQKEEEYYDRCIREREWNEKAKGKGLKRHRINSVCLCFSTKSRKRNKERRKQL